MPVHTSSPQTPPTEHIAQPPSTVDTAALSEEPLPGEGHCTALYTCGAVNSKKTKQQQQLIFGSFIASATVSQVIETHIYFGGLQAKRSMTAHHGRKRFESYEQPNI